MPDFSTLLLQSLSFRTTPCKICGGEAKPYGNVDFNKSCEDEKEKKLPFCNVPIAYSKCIECGFVYTNAFDKWKDEEFKKFIYNDEYIKVDPDYIENRPYFDADRVDKLFPQRDGIRILDYGGGNGKLERILLERGFPYAETYDPFVDSYATPPSKNYNLVTCVETLEHLPDPAAGIKKIADCVSETGIVMFTTLVQNQFSDKEGIDWWYISPRNGHISIFTMASLTNLWTRHGFGFGSLNTNLHLAWSGVPDFAKHILGAGKKDINSVIAVIKTLL